MALEQSYDVIDAVLKNMDDNIFYPIEHVNDLLLVFCIFFFFFLGGGGGGGGGGCDVIRY